MLSNLRMVWPKKIRLIDLMNFFLSLSFSYLFTIFFNWMRSIMFLRMITRKKTSLTKIVIKTTKTSVTTNASEEHSNFMRVLTACRWLDRLYMCHIELHVALKQTWTKVFFRECRRVTNLFPWQSIDAMLVTKLMFVVLVSSNWRKYLRERFHHVSNRTQTKVFVGETMTWSTYVIETTLYTTWDVIRMKRIDLIEMIGNFQ